MRSVVDCALAVPYAQYEPARRLIEQAGARLEEPEFAGAVTLRWRMPAGQEGPLCAALGELLRGAAAVTVSPPHFAPF